MTQYSLPQALGRAALCVYLPVLLAMPLGPLMECGHCVRRYLSISPIVPGLLPGTLFGSHGPNLWIAGAASLLILGAATLLQRSHLPRLVKLSFWVLFALSLFNSLGVTNMLRA